MRFSELSIDISPSLIPQGHLSPDLCDVVEVDAVWGGW